MSQAPGTALSAPTLSIVIAARNEAPYIERNLRSLLANDYPADRVEIIVVDGMSTDGTADVVRRLARQAGNIRLLENPLKITPVAFNLGIAHIRCDIVFFLAVHASVTPEFLRRSVQALGEHPAAWCAGGAIQTISETFVGQAISAALSCPVGVGNAKFRLGGHKGYVDTVTFCCYWRWVFDRIGLFDEQLVRNQDDEFNLRLILAGGKIYMDGDIVSYYYSRGSLQKLARQYYQYGFWRIRTIEKHRRPAALRQWAPMAFVCALTAMIAAAQVWRPMTGALAGFAGLYAMTLVAGAVDVARKSGIRHASLAPLVFMTLHFCYGLGSVHGVLTFLVFRRGQAIDTTRHALSR